MPERLQWRPTHLVEVQEVEPNFSALDSLQQHFIYLYGRRNDVYLTGRTPRIELFYRGVADAAEAIRKGAPQEGTEDMFARVVSRIFCIAHGINNVSVSEGMLRKYPMGGCSYCHSFPCQCVERRGEVDLGWSVDSSQLQWDLKDWQKHLDSLYGDKNKQKGIDYILNRLSLEFGELISLEHEVPTLTMDKVESEYQLELADSLAWIIAAANF